MFFHIASGLSAEKQHNELVIKYPNMDEWVEHDIPPGILEFTTPSGEKVTEILGPAYTYVGFVSAYLYSFNNAPSTITKINWKGKIWRKKDFVFCRGSSRIIEYFKWVKGEWFVKFKDLDLLPLSISYKSNPIVFLPDETGADIPMYEGDIYYWCNPVTSGWGKIMGTRLPVVSDVHYFATAAARDKYQHENKPLISLAELKQLEEDVHSAGLFDGDFQKLREKYGQNKGY